MAGLLRMSRSTEPYPDSAVTIDSCCVAGTLTTTTTLSCTASSAGGTSGPVSVTVKIDKTAPVISKSVGTPKHVSGTTTYVTSATQVTVTVTDANSGVAS